MPGQHQLVGVADDHVADDTVTREQHAHLTPEIGGDSRQVEP